MTPPETRRRSARGDGGCRSAGLRTSAARGRRTRARPSPLVESGDPAGSSPNAVPAAPRFRNDCKAFRPPPRWTPARVAVGDISPENFYRRYVATRTPCVLTTAAGDATSASRLLGKAPPCWSLDELKERAGHVAVKVESIGSHGSFGKGTPRRKMLFARFLDAIARQGRTDLYLTTQYQDEEQPDAEGDAGDGNKKAELRWKAHAYCQAPLAALFGDIELRPPLFGKLVPQQVNLWLGAVPAGDENGTSSGLHHDFHDNLYVLLRGRKRFTLFSPHDAGRMYLHGRLSHVHSNGLINYRGAETRSDGANPLDVARWRPKRAMQRLAAAEAAGETDAVAEDELERAMDALLDADCLDEEYDDGLFLGNAEKRKRRLDAGGTAPRKRKAVAGFVETGSSEPPSFSKIPASALHCPKKLGPFPLLSGARKVTCDLREGDILYLPASWFHEVTSYGLRADDGETHSNDGIHMAFNYWMVPPATDDPAKPYEDDYWESEWAEVERAILDGILCEPIESKSRALPRPSPAQETPVSEQEHSSSTRPTRRPRISRPAPGLAIASTSSLGGAAPRRGVRNKRKTRPKPRWIVKDA